MNWVWLKQAAILALHNEQLAEHGGGAGVRDLALLESALARPLNLVAYGDPDAEALAAAYAAGIVRNHPFVDGNKRTGFIAAALFLELNGRRFDADEVDVVRVVLQLAAGDLTEEAFADWLRVNSAPAD